MIPKHIKTYFKDRNLQVAEDKDLSLYGFTMIKKIGNTPVAFLNIGQKTVFVRILDEIHLHHLDKLDRLRKNIVDASKKFNVKKEVNERRADWFRKVHTEVYKRGRV
jgi:hypothetical protein